MEILSCNDLTKIYGTGPNAVTALDHVTLSVESGEFVAIVGASGSGKSTLLHLLGGVDRPSEGEIRIEDTDISTRTRRHLPPSEGGKLVLSISFTI